LRFVSRRYELGWIIIISHQRLGAWGGVLTIRRGVSDDKLGRWLSDDHWQGLRAVTAATDHPDLEFVIAKSSGTLIAREALERKSGARGLLAIMVSIMVYLM
jgi:ATP-dependent protease Clp ATPase subunit